MNGNTIHPTNTTAVVGGGPAPARGWREFCELHAIATARQLAGHYRSFARERPHQDVLPPELFSKQFTDLFQQHFCCEVDKDGAPTGQDYREAGRPSAAAAHVTAALPKAEPAVVNLEQEQSLRCAAGNLPRIPVVLRGSAHSVGSGAPLIRSRSNEELPAQTPAATSATPRTAATEWAACPFLTSWLRLGSMRHRRPDVGDCCKEGQLRYLLVDDTISDNQPHWQRCRLLVRRIRDSQGQKYVLELYDPPKASSPKLTSQCSDIQEVRRCNRLEMPDNINTFVLKVVRQGSWIFETDNDQQVSSWTTEIKECVNNRGQAGADVEPLPTTPDFTAPAGHRGSAELGGQTADPASLPPPEPAVQKTDHFLFSYPWFHGPISRVKAAHLVQSSGPEGHGVFLVRQSETRRGDYVLTFNYQGKAKHLRLSLTEWGQCRVQHLRFPSVMDMLSHFRLYPIPLECGAAGCNRCPADLLFLLSPSSGALLIPFSLHRWSSE
uniref:SH2B adaptor protein 3 n=1 Tax=Tetraodon nigroviridis TaxID=99883 RepID=H3BYX8_TETNG